MSPRKVRILASLSGVLALMLSAWCAAAADDAAPKTFPTAHAAVRALVAAARADDAAALLALFGPEGKELVNSGDEVADRTARAHFVAAYDADHQMRNVRAGRFILDVGKSGWPMPIPIVKKDGQWSFDAAAGAQEVLARRIGRNELAAMRVCHALIDAENAYARGGHDGNPAGLYTRRLNSEPGTQNGLYWEVPEGQAASPAGPFVAQAWADGYSTDKGKGTPYYGYYYRVLTAQGEHAHGGARDYLVDGKLSGGIALVAYPAEYRNSGVMTFIVSRHGTIWQKDLGADTEAAARAMTVYDPDPASWNKAE